MAGQPELAGAKACLDDRAAGSSEAPSMGVTIKRNLVEVVVAWKYVSDSMYQM